MQNYPEPMQIITLIGGIQVRFFPENVTPDLFEGNKGIKQLHGATSKAESPQPKVVELNKTKLYWKKPLDAWVIAN